MGEVYRARDTRLDRSVAVKVLAPALATDADFRARFAREAKAISALNHPHICGLYDIGREHDTDYLVLELLEGETLAARLVRGPLPLSQVLRVGIEIADALEAAHRQGIVHRDLKPGNVMLTPAGPKLLDFGLAKNTVGPAGTGALRARDVATDDTAEGTILGTLPYMAPEQVQGLPADARTDLFALGTILHEMATGRRAFEATTQASLVAKILETEPPVVSSLAPLTPPAFDHVVQSCLAKAPADRWQTAHDVKLQLQWIQAQGSHIDGVTPVAVTRRRTAWVPWVVAGAAGVIAATTLLRPHAGRDRGAAGPFRLVLPPEMRRADYDRGAISPDGQAVRVRSHRGGPPAIGPARPGIHGIGCPGGNGRRFQSVLVSRQPVGRVLPTDGHLKRVPLTGGPDTSDCRRDSDCRRPDRRHVARRRDPVRARGRTYLSRRGDGRARPPLSRRVPGKPGQRRFAFPRFLPDGRHFLVTVVDDPAVYVASLDTPGLRKVMDDGASAVYAAGHLFYSRGSGCVRASVRCRNDWSSLAPKCN